MRDKLIAALRSGRYVQCKHVLHVERTDRFCAAGVACDVINPTWNEATWVSSETHAVFMPHICQKFDLPVSVVNEMMRMNDQGKTFAEIADWLEAKYD